MFSQYLLFACGLILSINGWAIDTVRCPQEISWQSDVERVFKSSIYKNVPGWKDAQNTLSSIKTFETEFTLVARKNSSCLYQDEQGNSAVLSTASFQDPDENGPSLEDQLTVNLKLNGSLFVTFLPIKSYSPNHIATYNTPYALKIKTRLFYAQTNRWDNFDLGMISVSVH